MRFTKSLSLGALALALAVGCAPSNPGLTAEGVLTTDAMCGVTSTSNLLLQGLFDLSTTGEAAHRLTVSYSVAVRVGNQLINQGNRVYPVMADPDRINVDHMEVTLLNEQEAPLGLGLPNPYLVPAVGTIGSTSSMDPTFGIANATVIPDAYGRALATTFPAGSTGMIVVQLRVIGTTAGGSMLTSGPMLFPIQICYDCLFRSACDSMSTPTELASCLPGQDAVSYFCP